MKKGTLVLLAVVTIGFTAMVTAFMNTATPYVTIAEAKKSRGSSFHLVGEIVPGSIRSLPREGLVQFHLKDAAGETVMVEYRGHAPASLETATRVDAVGAMAGDVYRSNKLLLKCPSKYESDAAAGSRT